jgi:DNA-binding response OmpR family regulator
MRLLVAEDDPALGIFLQRGFGAENYAVDLTEDCDRAKSMVESNAYDLAILDLNHAEANGLSFLQYLRTTCQRLPILILTARGRVVDRIQVLDMGADDYVLKPFAFSELSARVRALLRRGGRVPEAVLRVEDLELNRLSHSVARAGKAVKLSPKEFALLEYLMTRAGQSVARAEILQHVWNFSPETMTKLVDVYVNYIRKKIDGNMQRKLIHTIRGVGYQISASFPIRR